jgi:hypothetical protein
MAGERLLAVVRCVERSYHPRYIVVHERKRKKEERKGTVVDKRVKYMQKDVYNWFWLSRWI